MRKFIPILALLILAVLPAWTVQLPASGGANPFALVAHTAAVAQTGLGANSVTTSGITTTGALRITVQVSYNMAATTPSITDSNANTWTQDIASSGTVIDLLTYHCQPCTVGAGHTFTAVTAGGTPLFSIAVQAWSGTPAGALDQSSSAAAVGSSALQPGSITPTAPNELVVLVATASTGASTVNSGYTITDDIAGVSAASFGITAAYLLQTAAAATNPTVSSAAQGYNAAIGSYK